MKKGNKSIPKLELKAKKILVLNPSEQGTIKAGEDNTVFTRPSSYACPPPFNQPPLLTMKGCI